MSDREQGPDAGRALPAERRMARLLVRLEAGRRAAEATAALGTADMRMLWLLSDGNPRTLREISESIGLEKSTVNRQVNAALREGLVERRRPSGCTSAVLSPTEHGRALFDHEVDRVLDHYRAGLARLGGEEHRLLDRLEQFLTGLEESTRAG